MVLILNANELELKPHHIHQIEQFRKEVDDEFEKWYNNYWKRFNKENGIE